MERTVYKMLSCAGRALNVENSSHLPDSVFEFSFVFMFRIRVNPRKTNYLLLVIVNRSRVLVEYSFAIKIKGI